MRARVSLSLLMLLVVTVSSPAQVEEAKITPEEVREARVLVSRLEERLRATNDLGPILDELFVGDFQERLWQAPRHILPWYFLDQSLITYADRAALRRYYVVSANFYALCFRLAEADKALKERAGSDERDAKLAELLPPEVIAVLLGDPTIARLVEETREYAGDGREGLPSGGDTEETGGIKTQPQLDAVSSTLEKANGLLRERLAGMKAGDGGTKGRDESRRPSATTLDEDEYGFPKGTRVIHASASGFFVTMIRIDGRLRVLSAALYYD